MKNVVEKLKPLLRKMKSISLQPLLLLLILSAFFHQVGFAADLMTEESLGKIKYEAREKEIIGLLGNPETKGKDVNWDAIGEWVQEWEFPSQGLTLHMASAKKNGAKTVLMITAGPGCKLVTARGIKIGSSLAEVRKAYGNLEDKENSSGQTFVAGSIYGGIIFSFKDSKVTKIFIGAAAE